MTTLFDKALRAAVAAFLLLVAGCGPGTGGTGTGPLPSATTFSGQANSASPSCHANCSNLVLRFDESQVELLAACVRFVHDGGLPAATTGEILLPGRVESAGSSGTVAAPATLRLLVAGGALGDATQVTVSLHGETGATLLGPVVLGRGDAGQAPPAQCATP